MAKIKTDENASGGLDQDQTDDVSCVSSLHTTWRNLGGPSPIQQPRLNRNDSKLGISSQPLIKDETPNPMVTPKFAIK